MKRVLMFGLAAVMAATMAGCSSNSDTSAETAEPSEMQTESPSQEPAFDVDTYKTDAAACGRNIYDQALVLGNMLTYEGNYIKSISQFGGTLDSSKAVQSACEHLQKGYDNGDLDRELFNNVSETTLKNSYDEISSQYMNIAEIDTDNAIASDIREQLKSMYESYVTMYGGATAPTSSTVTAGLSAINNISETAKMLTTLTGETIQTDAAA